MRRSILRDRKNKCSIRQLKQKVQLHQSEFANVQLYTRAKRYNQQHIVKFLMMSIVYLASIKQGKDENNRVFRGQPFANYFSKRPNLKTWKICHNRNVTIPWDAHQTYLLDYQGTSSSIGFNYLYCSSTRSNPSMGSSLYIMQKQFSSCEQMKKNFH